jgi:Pentapeptide repeats (8 copies)
VGFRERLRANCAECVGLCCVAPAFVKSADFAITKPAGKPCPNLQPDFRCGIHSHLRETGFPGCTVFDCFGAGQRLTAAYAGRSWRDEPGMLTAFPILRDLHELLYYLSEALEMPAAASVYPQLTAMRDKVGKLADGDLATVNVDALRGEANPLLLEASELTREVSAGRAGPDHRGARLFGASMRGAKLRRASLRGAILVGADLRDADLCEADVIGADFRGADLRGADLTGALFLTQAQLDAARGDVSTRVSPALRHPAHWSSSAGTRGSASPRRGSGRRQSGAAGSR